jgi:hypothetical protein
MKDQNKGDPLVEKWLKEMIPVPPRDTAKAARGRAKFLNQASELQHAVSTSEIRRHSKWNNIPRKEKFVVNALISILVTLALLAGGGATVAAAQDDLPTETLYQVKIFTEDARLMLNSDPQTEIDMLMEMSQERVREMIALSETGIVPPNQVALRLEQHIRQAMDIAGTFEGQALTDALSGIQTSLQTQEQLMTQAQNQAMGEPAGLMTQTQAMLQTRLRMVDEGLADPQGFQYNTQNERQFGQDDNATPFPNQQGEPAQHQNDQAPKESGNGPNSNGPKNTEGAPEPENLPMPAPTPAHGNGPGPGGNNQGGKD